MERLKHFLESTLYPVKPLPPPNRTKEMQVLALGLSRSGTESLCNALKILGYDHVYHGFDVPTSRNPAISKALADFGRRRQKGEVLNAKDLDVLLGDCEAVTDQPCACFAMELIQAYPSAKVILNYREDVEAWHTSLSNTFGTYMSTYEFRYLSYFSTYLYWLKEVFMMYENDYYQGSIVGNGRRIREEHYGRIRGAVDKERMLEWKVQDGWGPLCEFLDKDVPEMEFPNGNTPAQTAERGARLRWEAKRKAYWNLGIVVVGMVSVTVGVIAWVIR